MDGQAGAMHYDYVIDPTVDSVQTRAVELVGRGRTVLDLGCAAGAYARELSRRGCRVVGVEADPEAAKQAALWCDEVITADLERLDLVEAMGERRFDVVLAADVLEHLKDPDRVLRGAASLLTEGGYLVAVVPNVAHGSVRLALLGGEFPYSDLGLLDRTHLRFYTLRSLQELLEGSGFTPVYTDRMPAPVEATEVPIPASVLAEPGVLDFVRRAPEATTYQFLVLAFPTPASDDVLPALLRRLSHVVGGAGSTSPEEAVNALVAEGSPLAGLRLELLAARDERARRESELELSRAHARELAAEVGHLQGALQDSRAELAAERAARAAAEAEVGARLAELEARLRSVQASRVWRAAAGIRRVRAFAARARAPQG